MKYLILSALLLLACDPSYLDEGLMVRDGHELYAQPPLGVSATSEMLPYVLSATQWWNRQLRDTVFFSPTPTPDITISSGYVPAEDFDVEEASGGAAGIAVPAHSRVDGLIISCKITVSSDIPDARTVTEVTKHELGHCLGLDDDPPSLDLNSIMSKPMPWRGEVTPGDRALILEMIDGL